MARNKFKISRPVIKGQTTLAHEGETIEGVEYARPVGNTNQNNGVPGAGAYSIARNAIENGGATGGTGYNEETLVKTFDKFISSDDCSFSSEQHSQAWVVDFADHPELAIGLGDDYEAFECGAEYKLVANGVDFGFATASDNSVYNRVWCEWVMGDTTVRVGTAVLDDEPQFCIQMVDERLTEAIDIRGAIYKKYPHDLLYINPTLQGYAPLLYTTYFKHADIEMVSMTDDDDHSIVQSTQQEYANTIPESLFNGMQSGETKSVNNLGLVFAFGEQNVGLVGALIGYSEDIVDDPDVEGAKTINKKYYIGDGVEGIIKEHYYSEGYPDENSFDYNYCYTFIYDEDSRFTSILGSNPVYATVRCYAFSEVASNTSGTYTQSMNSNKLHNLSAEDTSSDVYSSRHAFIDFPKATQHHVYGEIEVDNDGHTLRESTSTTISNEPQGKYWNGSAWVANPKINLANTPVGVPYVERYDAQSANDTNAYLEEETLAVSVFTRNALGVSGSEYYDEVTQKRLDLDADIIVQAPGNITELDAYDRITEHGYQGFVPNAAQVDPRTLAKDEDVND